jgi:hypothetical protein
MDISHPAYLFPAFFSIFAWISFTAISAADAKN